MGKNNAEPECTFLVAKHVESVRGCGIKDMHSKVNYTGVLSGAMQFADAMMQGDEPRQPCIIIHLNTSIVAYKIVGKPWKFTTAYKSLAKKARAKYGMEIHQ